MDKDEYRELVERFQPVPIHSREQVEQTESVIDDLLALPERTAARDAFLELLSMLVGEWEDANVAIPGLNGRELVAVLVQERGLRHKDLVPVLGTESVVSEVLSGKRQLSLRQIASLARFFHVSPAVFMQDLFADAELAPA